MKATFFLSLAAAVAVVVNPLAAASAASPNANHGPSVKPLASIADLGVGTIEIGIREVDGTKRAVDFNTNLESIVGATITVPGQKKNLVSLRARTDESEEQLQTIKAEADVSVGSESLAGPRLHALVAVDLSHERVLQLTLRSKTGGSYLIRLHKESWSEGQVTLNLTGTGGCITYTASCTGCHGTIQKECCGGTLDVCIDCSGCKIDCDNRCTATVE